MPDVLFLADVPSKLPAGDSPVSRIAVARLGRFKHGRYGRFTVTRKEYENWRHVLETVFPGRVPLDVDHGPEKGGSSEAAGWITALDENGQDGNTPTPNLIWATVEWTPLGVELVKERRYLYVSPVMFANWEDEEGRKHGPAMPAASLTNRPHFQSMPAVSLSREPLLAEQVSDSRPSMPDFTKIAEALKLDADADEAKILDAIAEAQKAPEKPAEEPEPKTLNQLATEANKRVLDADTFDKLTAGAEAGVAAQRELADIRFTATFDKALGEGRIDAKPETRENLKALYVVKPDETLKMLDGLQKIVNTEAQGDGGTAADAPEGVDQESYELDRKVKAHMTEHKQDDYSVALDAVLTEQERQGAAV